MAVTKRKRRDDHYRVSELNFLVRELKRGAKFATACRAAGLDPSRVREYMMTDDRWKQRIEQPIARNVARAEQALFRAGTKRDGYGRLNERATMHYLTNVASEDWSHRRDGSAPRTMDPLSGNGMRVADLPPEKRDHLQTIAKDLILANAKQRREDQEKLH